MLSNQDGWREGAIAKAMNRVMLTIRRIIEKNQGIYVWHPIMDLRSSKKELDVESFVAKNSASTAGWQLPTMKLCGGAYQNHNHTPHLRRCRYRIVVLVHRCYWGSSGTSSVVRSWSRSYCPIMNLPENWVQCPWHRAIGAYHSLFWPRRRPDWLVTYSGCHAKPGVLLFGIVMLVSRR
jgi:hypothetical protein